MFHNTFCHARTLQLHFLFQTSFKYGNLSSDNKNVFQAQVRFWWLRAQCGQSHLWAVYSSWSGTGKPKIMSTFSRTRRDSGGCLVFARSIKTVQVIWNVLTGFTKVFLFLDSFSSDHFMELNKMRKWPFPSFSCLSDLQADKLELLCFQVPPLTPPFIHD